MPKKKRMSAAKKEDLVLRLLRGEDVESVSRESGIALHLLTQWRDSYTQAGREGLKAHPGNPVQNDLQKVITQQSLEIEILKKAKALVDGRKL